MVYEINGKYGLFTIDAENNLIASTLCYLISSNNSVFITQPVVEQYDATNQKEYLLENSEVLKNVLLNYLPGSRFKREETFQLLLDFEESEKSDMFKTLRQTYMDDKYYELDDRIKKVISILNFLKKE